MEEQDPTSPPEGVIFLTTSGEQILTQELEVPSEEKEEEIYYNIPLIEEPE